LDLAGPDPDRCTSPHLVVLEVDHVSTVTAGAMDEDVESDKFDWRPIKTISLHTRAERRSDEPCIRDVHTFREVEFDPVHFPESDGPAIRIPPACPIPTSVRRFQPF
jgi:hypothetical protein